MKSARELKLRPFDSESKTTSDCGNRLFSKKITPNSYFSFYQYKSDSITEQCFINIYYYETLLYETVIDRDVR